MFLGVMLCHALSSGAYCSSILATIVSSSISLIHFFECIRHRSHIRRIRLGFKAPLAVNVVGILISYFFVLLRRKTWLPVPNLALRVFPGTLAHVSNSLTLRLAAASSFHACTRQQML